MNAPVWFVAANAVVLVLSSSIAGVLFFRLQRQWQTNALLRALKE